MNPPPESWPARCGRAVGSLWRNIWGATPAVTPVSNASAPATPRLIAPAVEPALPKPSLESAALRAFLRDVGTSLWRMTRKMVPEGSTEPLDEMSSVYRYVESMWEAMREMGVQVQDHTNEPFDSGMPLVSLAFQPTAGLKRETILETIKPSIYLGQERIQTGEVIVGTPIAPITPQSPAVAVVSANGAAGPEVLHPVETEPPPAVNTTAVVSETTPPEESSFDLGSETPATEQPAPNPLQEPVAPASAPAVEGDRNA